MNPLCQVIKMQGEYWGVFLVNPDDSADRYLMTSPLDKKSEAEHFRNEFDRILDIYIHARDVEVHY